MPGVCSVRPHEEVEVVDLRLIALLLHESCERIALRISYVKWVRIRMAVQEKLNEES